MSEARRPLVLVIGGLDPSGAGLQADIETCFSLGIHALPVASAVTVQSTASMLRAIPISPADVHDQIKTVLSDCGPVAACKIGMLAGLETAEAVAVALDQLPRHIPVILDPVLRATSGARLMDESLKENWPRRLLERVTLVKPNRAEARAMRWVDEHGPYGGGLIPEYLLVTGTDDALGSEASHQLFRAGRLCREFILPVRPGSFHGTGCTLTSAIASFCALGLVMPEAVAAALDYAWRSVREGYSIGGQQSIPERRRTSSSPDFRAAL